LLLYEKAESDLSTLSDKVRASANGPHTRKYDAERQLKTCRDKVTTLNELLTAMESDPPKFGIGEGELTRRRGLMTKLNKLVIDVEDSLSGASSRTKRDLLSAGGMSGGANVNGDGEDDATRNMSHHEIYQTTQQQMARQDQSLDQISRGVASLKDMGQSMSAELDLHTSLLNNMSDQIDKTDAAFRNNTKRIDIVQEEDGSGAVGCGLMICMVLLLVLIIFLASSNQACHIFNSKKC